MITHDHASPLLSTLLQTLLWVIPLELVMHQVSQVHLLEYQVEFLDPGVCHGPLFRYGQSGKC